MRKILIGDMIQQITCPIGLRANNEATHICCLIAGIRQLTIKSVEIIWVDSVSTDDTVVIPEECGVNVIPIFPEKFAFGLPLNQGITAGCGKYIILGSGHCYPVYQDWLEKLLEPFENETIAINYGKQRGGETNHYSEHQIFNRYFPDISQPHQGNPYTQNADLLLILVAHAKFKKVRTSDFNKIRKNLVLDACNCLDTDCWKNAGFEIFTLGVKNQ